MPLFPCFNGLGLGIFPLRIRCRIRAHLGLAVEPTCAPTVANAPTSEAGQYRLVR